MIATIAASIITAMLTRRRIEGAWTFTGGAQGSLQAHPHPVGWGALARTGGANL